MMQCQYIYLHILEMYFCKKLVMCLTSVDAIYFKEF